MESLYLLNGDDDFAKDDYLNKLQESFGKLEKGINYLLFDKDNISALGSELVTYSFFSTNKFIVVKVPKVKRKVTTENKDDNEPVEDNEVVEESVQKNWYTDELEEQILNKIDGITLVFVEDGSSNSKLNKLVSKYGKVVSFNKKKPSELKSWAYVHALSKNIKISKDLIEYLIEVCGSDVRTITNELEKLDSYTNNGPITKDDIDNVCTVSSDIIIFDLTDSMGSKNKSASLKNLDRLLTTKEPIQKILIMITRHFKSLIIAKEALLQKANVQKEIGTNSNFAANKIADQSRNFKMNELVNIFKELVKLDIDSKTSIIDIKIALQKIIMQQV